jgi:hypothetical protein
MRAAGLLAGLLVAAGAATGQTSPYDGDWTIGNPAACAVGTDSVNFAFRIGDGLLRGVESACRMTNPVAVRDLGATLYDMECQGEGDSWTYRNFLMLDREGALVMINDGYVSILSRCTGYEGPVTPSRPLSK